MFAVLRHRDEVDQAIEQDRKERELRVLELKKDFESRRREAHRRRWTLDEGPRTRLNWFEEVSFRERWSDRWHAISDALTRVHREVDPILSYDRRLVSQIEVARVSMRIKWAKKNTIEEGHHGLSNDDYAKDTHEREVAEKRADVVIAQKELEHLEQLEQEVGTRHLTALHESLSQELTRERAVFDKWFSKLARPAYWDRLGDIQTWFKSKARPSGDEATSPQPDTLWQRLKKKLGKLFYVAPAVLIPVEVFFALPGFEFLTPDDKLAAIMGAVIYTALLAVLGHAAALFVLRGIINRVDDSDGEATTIYRPRALFAAFVLLICAISMSFAGADLRGKLSDIAALKERRTEWVNAKSQVRQQAINDINMERSGAIAIENEKLATERAKIEEVQRNLYTLSYSLEKSDKMIALWVYFGLFLVAAGGVILSRDPIFEYELATVAVRERERALRRIEVAKEIERLYWRDQVYKLRNLIAHRRAELGKIAPSDPLALPEETPEENSDASAKDSAPKKAAASTDHEIGSTHRKHGKLVAVGSEAAPHAEDESDGTSNPVVESFNIHSSAWRCDRLQRYTQWYGWFSWYGLDEYAGSRRRALARLAA